MVFDFTPAPASEPVRISLRPGSTTVAAGATYVFDAAGRLLTAAQEDRFCKRGLDHLVLEKRRPPGARRGWHYRALAPAERDALVDDARAAAARVQAALPDDAPPALAPRLAAAAAWDAAAYAEETRRFHTVYRPVGILPPDQYLAAVVQATEGCHHNRCTFCSFYRGVPFRIKDEAAFRAHVAAVRGFLGAGLALRRTLFLADANALVVPQRRLLPLFHVLREAFDVAPAGLPGRALAGWLEAHPGGMAGVYSFVDAFTGTKKTADDFAELAALGLRRLYLGMESGHVPLLRFLDKPSDPDDVAAVVDAARRGGVSVAVIVLAGIGGDRFAEAHVSDTAAVLGRLGLGAGDLVYLSPFVETPGAPYAGEARAAGIRPLSSGAVAEQAEQLRRLVPPGPRTALYPIQEFIY